MSQHQEQYRRKLISAEEVVSLVKNGDQIWAPVGAGEPQTIFATIASNYKSLFNVTVNQILPLKPFFAKKEMAPHIRYNSWFTSDINRTAVNEGWADFTANNFHEVPKLLRLYWPVDIVMASVSPMDKHGYFSLSLSVDYTFEAIKKAKMIILEVNPNYPRTLGNCFVHISQVDYIVESNAPVPILNIPPITEVEQKIGEYIADLIEDGSTLQIGFGGIPNAVTAALKNKKNLGIHTEMITDGMVNLVEWGVVDNSRKTLHPGKVIGTFAIGTQRLYDFLDNNPMVEMHPVDYTNDPYIIGRNNQLVAINASIEVDLLGQCCSESMGHYQWSATGGQADFFRGANISPGGKGFVTLASTAKNGTVSRIVPELKPGAVVTTSKNDVDYVVTEYGVAKLRGKTARERALELINIAHPDFRAELREAARKYNLI
ncbi:MULTISPECIES: acetyl-CoA hydrolase/transferase family protein [Carboxydocella]|uniref:Acyl-CoA hydrolase n=2 Tax=Carboxydocella TaxID=178898 RepID=A0A1T4LU75_9FIRM|nr:MULTISPECIES: acetyl-CoA hydrolase/transferase C-terminal domain-containing protein [Carboxydocella]AVX20616.1 Acyl-CoA hydrolase [Carboxydocella thermautotrophica]AVX31038.1 Acyl-CoA hydrolase [Carboxydocella thermautotrophica]SJZ58280.1 Acyl-CoA hydrolase [Carboxydocella sporoproducens DSM 16521]GAW27939.1 4-hydroxybutyrate CoA-transferase [Carboxydocella sp. ULO1]GAW31544.1 4-hydroxybutyrate CoA-transferase [Carboxydocella sp. JDF658]